jgi:hypothetical protein
MRSPTRSACLHLATAVEVDASDTPLLKVFGCERCYGEDAATIWANKNIVLEVVTTLVDKSHFDVSIRRCQTCQQQFVFVFTEITVWVEDGEPQYSTLIPIDGAEAETIRATGQRPDLEWIGALGQDRRWLYNNWPSGKSASIGWSTGTAPLMEGY